MFSIYKLTSYAKVSTKPKTYLVVMAEFSMTFRNQEVWHVRKAKALLMSSFILLLSKSDHIISYTSPLCQL